MTEHIALVSLEDASRMAFAWPAAAGGSEFRYTTIFLIWRSPTKPVARSIRAAVSDGININRYGTH
jgi:hypothetical protein